MRRWVLRTLGLALAAALVLLIAAWRLPLPPGLERPHATLVLDEDGQWLRAFASPDQSRTWRIPVRGEELPEDLIAAVLAFEDRRFFLHPGIDPVAVLRAAYDNLRARRVVSGASTITMQVARMMERRPRTLGAKLSEAFRALQLELRFEKRDILVHYLNLAPYGGNIEGVGAAAWFYYGRPVSKLHLDELATLAAIPNSPNRYRPDRGPEVLRQRRDDVLKRMAADGRISLAAAEEAISLPIRAVRRSAPMLAPHLSEYLRGKSPGAAIIKSTIDAELQHRVSKLLAEHVRTLEPHGIGNAAAVVIENETGAVRAWVGSKAFFDVASQGQVDGVLAPRSPGSTLKPFVYGLALDRGLVGLHTLLEDIPVYYRDWAPENFDGEWRGVVSVKDALAASLNIPAVRVAEALEPEGLVSLLHHAGFAGFQRGLERFGLSTVLGGCEVNLLELTNLYSSLAREGRHRRVALTVEELEAKRPETAWMGPGSAFLLGEILTDVQRPELPDLWRETVSLPRVAWKTGTSYGRRDAWSVGYTRRYSIGVWVGNFDPVGVPELVGTRAAAPLFFSIVNALPGVHQDPWFTRPRAVEEREVCALSGDVPTEACPHRVRELAVSNAPSRPCQHHVAVDVDDETGHRLCSRCRSGRPRHQHVSVVWPPRVASHLERGGYPVEKVPEHNPGCERGLAGAGPVIHRPLDGDEFVLREGVPEAHQQIALLASAESGSGLLHWFVDDAHFWSGPPGVPVMLDPAPGHHRLVAVDQEGRSAEIRIRIEH